jgi:hypothetical protein
VLSLKRDAVLVRALFLLLSVPAIAVMVNAPGIGYGYGLTVLAMIIASWIFNPLEAFLYLFASHAVATIIALETRSAFLLIFLLSNILRPLLALGGSILRRREGALLSSLILVSLDSIVALSIAVLYYGDDGIHAAFSLYEFVWIPFAYAMYSSAKRKDYPMLLSATLSSAIYELSIFAFLSLPPLLASIAALSVALFTLGREARILRGLAVLALLGVGVALGGASFKYNAKVMAYPFLPKSWSDHRWSVSGGACGNVTDVFKGVHDPSRLRIVEGCVTLTGRVTSPPLRFDDGDYCFDIKVVNGSYPISIGGTILRRGHVHVEIIPKDQKRLLKDIGGVCPGDLVRVTGTYVIDTDHGLWSEVHPAIKVEVLKRASPWPQCIWNYVKAKAEEYSTSG